MTHTHYLVLATIAALCFAGCNTTEKQTLRAEGKSIVRVAEGDAVKLGEAELQQLIESAAK